MTSKELVYRAIDFTGPWRLPRFKGPERDIITVGYNPPSSFTPTVDGEDEWGCLWKSLASETGDKGQVAEHPLIHWNRLALYRFPDPDAAGRYDGLDKWIAENSEIYQEKFVCASLGSGPMHLLDYLRGFEEYLCDLVLYPERIERLLDGIFLFLEGIVKRYAPYPIDAILLVDDQAIQSGPLFAMELWRKFFKPRYRNLSELAHAKGMKVFMHTCGHIGPHLVDLHEAGIDVIDNKQPALWMDSPRVDRVRGKLTFCTCIDIQTTIQAIHLEQVEGAVDELIRRLSVPAGGFIATRYDQENLRLPAENIRSMDQAFARFRWVRVC